MKTVFLSLLALILSSSQQWVKGAYVNANFDRLISLMPPPTNGVIMSDSQWTEFENRERLILPEDFKLFSNIYGCGRVFDLDVFTPNCSIGFDLQYHDFVKKLSFQYSQDEDLSTEAEQLVSLYPIEGGIYPWGSINRLFFGWKTYQETTRIITLENQVIVFEQFKTYQPEPDFTSFLLQYVEERIKYLKVGEKAEFVPMKIP